MRLEQAEVRVENRVPEEHGDDCAERKERDERYAQLPGRRPVARNEYGRRDECREEPIEVYDAALCYGSDLRSTPREDDRVSPRDDNAAYFLPCSRT